MDTEIILVIIQAIVLVGGFILAIRQVILLSKQIFLATQQLNAQLSWQKKQVTFNYINKYINELRNCNLSLQKKLGLLLQNGQEYNIDEMQKHIKDDSTRAELFELVSYFEQLAIGIEENYFDESILKKALLNVVTSSYSLIRPYLIFRRNETNRNVGKHFEELSIKWAQE